jgi:hypothetical protein
MNQITKTKTSNSMKTRTIIIASVVALFSVSISSANAQHAGEPSVKILPTDQKGVLKVLYVYDTDQPVEVKFLTKEEVLTSDKIKGATFQNGFSKKYDVRNITSRNFWIEVSSPNLTVTYKITESKDRKSFVPFLEKTTYNNSLVASNK